MVCALRVSITHVPSHLEECSLCCIALIAGTAQLVVVFATLPHVASSFRTCAFQPPRYLGSIMVRIGKAHWRLFSHFLTIFVDVCASQWQHATGSAVCAEAVRVPYIISKQVFWWHV